MTNDKELIYAALFSRLGGMTGVNTSSRKVKLYDECPPAEQPAVFLEQTQVVTEGQTGKPGKQTVKANVIIYAYDESPTGPMPAINGLVKQVEDLIRRQTGEESPSVTTTLGGLVASARVVSTDYSGGNLGAQGIAIVGVEILTVA